jgi:flagellar motor switch protein FliG
MQQNMNTPDSSRGPLRGARKAAILISVVGEDAAAPLLRSLPEEDLERIAEEVTRLGAVPAEISTQVLEEYQQLMAAQEFMASGGPDVAVRLLVKALGENGARGMVERLQRPDDGKSGRVDSLRKADPQQLAKFLAGEHPQTKTLVLAHLDAKQASSLLMKLDAEERADCVQRLANLRQFSPEAAAKVSTVVNRRLRSVGEQTKSEKNELRNIAEMMNRLDPISTREILEKIERSNPKLAIGIRDLMFTFEDFLHVAERDMREMAKSIDKKILLIALKGASEDLRSHFYRTMSARAVDLMKEDSEVMGPVRSKEVAKAQSEIVGIARQLEAEGTIALKTDEDDGYVF